MREGETVNVRRRRRRRSWEEGEVEDGGRREEAGRRGEGPGGGWRMKGAGRGDGPAHKGARSFFVCRRLPRSALLNFVLGQGA